MLTLILTEIYACRLLTTRIMLLTGEHTGRHGDGGKLDNYCCCYFVVVNRRIRYVFVPVLDVTGLFVTPDD